MVMKTKTKKPKKLLTYERELVKTSLPKTANEVLCECGNPVNSGSPQCWACSHRT